MKGDRTGERPTSTPLRVHGRQMSLMCRNSLTCIHALTCSVPVCVVYGCRPPHLVAPAVGPVYSVSRSRFTPGELGNSCNCCIASPMQTALIDLSPYILRRRRVSAFIPIMSLGLADSFNIGLILQNRQGFDVKHIGTTHQSTADAL